MELNNYFMDNELMLSVSTFVGIIFLTIIVAHLVNRFFNRFIRRVVLETGKDPTTHQFLRHSSRGIIYLVGFSIAIYSVPSLRTLAGSLLAGAGILAVAVGFASQHALSNIISGVFIVIFKPFRINDRLQIRTMAGIVEDITLRHTVIRDFENKRILIPNAVISDEIIINSDFAEDKLCKWIDVNISYDSDIDQVRKIMCDEVYKHPLRIDPRSEEDKKKGVPEVVVRVLGLGENGVLMRAWAWAKDAPDSFVMSCDLYESIKKRFDQEGVTLSFPHRAVFVNKIHSNQQAES